MSRETYQYVYKVNINAFDPLHANQLIREMFREALDHNDIVDCLMMNGKVKKLRTNL